jgi:hypothetical protein
MKIIMEATNPKKTNAVRGISEVSTDEDFLQVLLG